MSLKAVIFDKDGVLVDSERGKYRAMERAVASYGYRELNGFEEWFFGRVGVPGLESGEMCIKRFDLKGVQPRELYERTEAIRRAMIDSEPAPVIESSVKFLKSLPRDRVKIGIASSDFPVNIEKHMSQIGTLSYVDAITSGEKGSGEVERDKPFPDIYLVTARKLGVAPEDCMGIEDTAPGIKAVKSAGMYCIGFRNPNSGKQDYSEADLVVADLNSPEVLDLFRKN